MTDVRWLNEDEMRAWRAWLTTSRLLGAELARSLQRHHGLSDTDYDILVRLSETPDQRIRMTELAEATLLSKSRLSHQITRMEQAGLVARESCASDRRGAFAVLTEVGLAKLREAAPRHVEDVRRYFVDPLTPEQVRQLGELLGLVAAALQGRDPHHAGTDCGRRAVEPVVPAAG